MKLLNYLSFFIGTSLILSSCVTKITKSDLPDFSDRLVVNASLDNINPISIEFSTMSWAYDTFDPIVEELLDVELLRGTTPVSLSLNPQNKRWESSVVPKEGESYFLRVSKNGYASAGSSLTIPSPPANKSAGYLAGAARDQNGGIADLVYVEFDDPAGEDFYEVQFHYYSETLEAFVPLSFELDDPSLSDPSTLQLYSGGFLFNDEQFNGKRKRLSVAVTESLTLRNSDIRYLIELRRVSKDYWTYWKSLQQFRETQDQQLDGPFGGTIVIHSNIIGGLGIFMGSNLSSDTLR
jgi:hypothetical protein